MSNEIKFLTAVKQLAEADNGRKTTVEELMNFKRSCSPEEITAYCEQLTEILGVPVVANK